MHRQERKYIVREQTGKGEPKALAEQREILPYDILYFSIDLTTFVFICCCKTIFEKLIYFFILIVADVVAHRRFRFGCQHRAKSPVLSLIHI